jgi:hypothetical protein
VNSCEKTLRKTKGIDVPMNKHKDASELTKGIECN